MCTESKLCRIHCFGASGSGATTLGQALAQRLGVRHFDSDDYGWEDTDPPFQKRRPLRERGERVHEAIRGEKCWVLSGSVWSIDILCSFPFTLVVFLYLDTNKRLDRLRARELERYGPEVEPGGARYEHSQQFLSWAASYDNGPMSERSLALHTSWLEEMPFPHLSLASDKSPTKLVDELLKRAST